MKPYIVDNKYAIVNKDGKCAIISPEDKIIVDYKYDSLSLCSIGLLGKSEHESFLITLSGDKKGLIQLKENPKNGKVKEDILLNPIYQEIRFYNGFPYLILTKDGKNQIFSRITNKAISKKKYDFVVNNTFTSGKFVYFKVYNADKEIFFVGQNGIEYYSK